MIVTAALCISYLCLLKTILTLHKDSLMQKALTYINVQNVSYIRTPFRVIKYKLSINLRILKQFITLKLVGMVTFSSIEFKVNCTVKRLTQQISI